MSRLAFLLLLALPLTAAPVPKAKEGEKSPLNGAWEVVDRQNDGKPVNAPPREFWVFTDDTYAIFSGLKDETGLSDPDRRTLLGSRSAIDPDAPTALDLKEKGLSMACRILLDGDDLHIGMSSGGNKARPAEAKPGPDIVYIKFRRVDPAKLKAK